MAASPPGTGPLSLRLLHPSRRAIGRLADGEAEGPERRRLRRHLLRCTRCRRRLAFLREVGRVARQAGSPPPPDLVDRILARRARGERTLLPLASPPRPARLEWEPRTATAAVLLLLGGAVALALLLPSGKAAAGSSDLRFVPARPAAGAALEVEYRPSALLAGEERLRLRGRYRTADDGPIRGALGAPLAADLRRVEGSLFRGTVTLPGDAVYAVFAVEDEEGRRLDTGGGRLFELLVHDRAGRPVYDALRQRFRVLERRNWAAATEAAREMTELYPQRAEGWFFLFGQELVVSNPHETDSIKSFYRDKLYSMVPASLPRPDPSGDELAALTNSARLLGDEELRKRLLDRLAATHPGHPLATRERLERLRAERGAAAYLEALEAEWGRTDPVSRGGGDVGLAVEALSAARELSDPGAIATWAARLQRLHPDRRGWVASLLAERPALRGLAAEFLIAELGRVGAEARRSLDQTRPEFERKARAERGRLRTELATLLLEVGNTAGALAALGTAADEVWDPSVFRRLGELQLQAGDSAAAALNFAAVAVDPTTGGATADSLRRRLGPAGETARWNVLLREAGVEMRRRLLAGSPPSARIPDTLRVADSGGRLVSLRKRLGDRPSLVVFLDPRSGPALALLPRLVAVAGGLERRGFKTMTIVPAREGPLRDRLAEGGALPVVYDVADAAAKAFGAWGSPRLYVVDSEGWIRGTLEGPEEALRLLEALPREPPAGEPQAA